MVVDGIQLPHFNAVEGQLPPYEYLGGWPTGHERSRRLLDPLGVGFSLIVQQPTAMGSASCLGPRNSVIRLGAGEP
jgi:hypothetical protein